MRSGQANGKRLSHRKQCIRDRLEELAGIFGIDVLGFPVLSNHLHVVVRTRPDVVMTWSDAEVALRWWRLFPQRRNQDGSPVLERLECSAETWVDLVRNFHKSFRHEAGLTRNRQAFRNSRRDRRVTTEAT